MAEFRPYVPNAVDFHPEEISDSDTIRAGGANFLGDVTMNGNEVTGLPAVPSGDTAAASKAYVDNVAAGLNIKEGVRARSTGNVNIATDAEAGDTIDGVTLATGDRIALFDQTTTTQDGIYIVQATGAAVRSDDFAVGSEQASTFFIVEEGTVHADIGYVVTNDGGSDVVGTDDLVLVRFTNLAITAGNGLDLTGGTLSVDLASPSGLEFSGNQLRVDVVDTNHLSIDGSGLNVEGVPTLFNIGATAVGATVTAVNLDTLTDGSNADALHTHAATQNVQATVGAGGVTIGDPVYFSANDTVSEVDAATAAEARGYVGIADATVAAAGTVGISTEGDLVTPASVAGSPAAGDLVYIAVGGGLTVVAPTASGSHAVVVGKMKNATVMFIGPGQYLGRRA